MTTTLPDTDTESGAAAVVESAPVPPAETAVRAGRSDEDLVAVLEAFVAANGRRPTRPEAMHVTGTGTGRATRLLSVLDQRHQWPTPADRPSKATGTRKPSRPGADRSRGDTDQPADTTRSAPRTGTGTADAGTGAVPATGPVPARQAPAAPVPVPGRGPVGDQGTGRFVSWLGFVFGSVMSIAANVLHTWLSAATEPPGWSPGIAPQVGAAVWPIALVVSVEVLSRVRWHRGGWWHLARYGGAGTVAFGSAIISYGHLRDVLFAWGYGHPGADVGPLVLDGLMVVSGFALLAISRPPQTPCQEVTR